MLQIGNEAGKLSPVTRLWSWKKSSISTVTSQEGDGLKLLIGFVSPNVSLKSGSKTVEWSGRKKIWKRPNLRAPRVLRALRAVMALMIPRWTPNLLHNDIFRVLLQIKNQSHHVLKVQSGPARILNTSGLTHLYFALFQNHTGFFCLLLNEFMDHEG